MIMDMIPLGQPILRVGHHSEGRHRRDLARIDSLMGKGVEQGREADEAERRARAASATQRQRESAPTTKRRIDKLEADRRYIVKHWSESPRKVDRLAELDDQLAYWREHLDAIGFRPLGKADMPAPGSTILVFLLGGREVELVRANPKTVTVRTVHTPWGLKYGYEDVRLVEGGE